MEKGTHELPDGTKLHVGTMNANQNFTSVTFPAAFAAAPVVFSQAQTVNGSAAIVTRQRNITGNGFQVRVQEEEGADGTHATERIGYIASEIASGSSYQIGTTGNTVTNAFQTISFSQTFAGAPLFLANMQTFNGTDPAGLRYRNLTPNNVQVFVEEERSADAETGHGTEVVGFAALQQGVILAKSGGAAPLSSSAGAAATLEGTATVTSPSIVWSNARNPLDVNDDSNVSALDVLLTINAMNAPGSHLYSSEAEGSVKVRMYYDVNNDGSLSPLDTLTVINYLNQLSAGEGEAPIALIVAPPKLEESAAALSISTRAEYEGVADNSGDSSAAADPIPPAFSAEARDAVFAGKDRLRSISDELSPPLEEDLLAATDQFFSELSETP